MTVGFFIFDDPIFGGLVDSLTFGLLVLTVIAIPIMYYVYNHGNRHAVAAQDP